MGRTVPDVKKRLRACLGWHWHTFARERNGVALRSARASASKKCLTALEISKGRPCRKFFHLDQVDAEEDNPSTSGLPDGPATHTFLSPVSFIEVVRGQHQRET